jgi:hypothetical protein
VAQLDEELSYKPEGRGLIPDGVVSDFSFTAPGRRAWGSVVVKALCY